MMSTDLNSERRGSDKARSCKQDETRGEAGCRLVVSNGRLKIIWVIGRFLLVPLCMLAIAFGFVDEARSKENPNDVKVGLFIDNIFDLDFSARDVEATFWIWFNHSKPEFDARKDIEVINAKFLNNLQYFKSELNNGSVWEQLKYSATLNSTWTLKNYPFDRQKIKFIFESTERDLRALSFVPDLKQSKLSDALSLAGWSIEGLSVKTSEVSYNTTFGDPTLKDEARSSYPRATFEVSIKRNGWRLFFSTFIGFVLSIALAGIVLVNNAFRKLTQVIEMDSQIDIGIGAIFSAVGTGYILESSLPSTTEFTLADSFQIAAYGVTFLTILSIIVIRALKVRGLDETALTIGKTLLASYVVVCVSLSYRVTVAVLGGQPFG